MKGLVDAAVDAAIRSVTFKTPHSLLLQKHTEVLVDWAQQRRTHRSITGLDEPTAAQPAASAADSLAYAHSTSASEGSESNVT